MAYLYNGKVIREGRGWIDSSGVQHPSNWALWTQEEKLSRGLVWQDDPAPYDSRFWWDANTPKAIEDVTSEDEEGNQSVVPGLKTTWKKIIKTQAGSLLSETDWYVVRNSETGEAIPESVSLYRTAVREASNTIEARIDAVDKHSAFLALFEIPVDANGIPTGNAPINDWPEA